MLEHIKGNTYKLQAYGLVEFILQLEKCIKEGYSVDDSNEGCPQAYLGNYETNLIKAKAKKETKE